MTDPRANPLRTRLIHDHYDALIVGSGPNGLAAAITLARAGCKVALLEAQDTLGGGLRSAAVTVPGFTHDLGSAIHPLGAGSSFFRSLPLADYGLRWVQPGVPLAHPLAGGRAAVLDRSLALTAEALGRDAAAHRWLFEPLVTHWDALEHDVLGPLLRWPRQPLTLARFGLRGGPPASLVARALFRDEPARALFAGLAAHAVLPFHQLTTSAVALLLGTLGHVVGWPFPEGGSQRLADALASYFRALGGEILTQAPVKRLSDLPPARAVLCDVTPRQLLTLAGDALPPRYRKVLERYRYGPGVFKLDYALAGPVPWLAEACRRAGTVHLGGSFVELAEAELEVARGRHPEKPYVLVAQQSLFDPTRAPPGQHTLWAYCHVPNGSRLDMTGAVEGQLERFAPGFKKLVVARSARGPAELQRDNPNLIGGDISGGTQNLAQLLARPVLSPNPYKTPLKGLYLCSSSTPPGGGVHGLCGFHAATRALAAELA